MVRHAQNVFEKERVVTAHRKVLETNIFLTAGINPRVLKHRAEHAEPYLSCLRLLIHVGFFRQKGLILSEVFSYMERSKEHDKNIS